MPESAPLNTRSLQFSMNWLPLKTLRSALENSVAAVSLPLNTLSRNRLLVDPSSNRPRALPAIVPLRTVESSQSFNVTPTPGMPRLLPKRLASSVIRREFMALHAVGVVEVLSLLDGLRRRRRPRCEACFKERRCWRTGACCWFRGATGSGRDRENQARPKNGGWRHMDHSRAGRTAGL